MGVLSRPVQTAGTPAGPVLALALALALAACGEISNDRLREGDVTGQVLRADKNVGLVVFLADEPERQSLQDDGRFQLSSVAGGDRELLVVANASEAIRLPVLVVPRDTTDLGLIDPGPGAFLRLEVTTTSSRPEDYLLEIERTHLVQVIAEQGSGAFTAGPLGAGCYWGRLTRGGQVAWREEICLRAGETHILPVQVD